MAEPVNQRRRQVLEAIYDVIDELNESRPPSERIARAEDAMLFGSVGPLDSLGLVNLIVSLEQRLTDQVGSDVTLVDEDTLARQDQVFRTVGTLAGFVEDRLATQLR
jgi:acyl carrier protein